MTTTTLTADQSDDDVEASVAAAGPRESDFLIQIEDEYQYVEWRGDQFVHPWQVKRGFLGTLPVAHSSGATVSVEPAIGGGGGVEVTDGVGTLDAELHITGPSGTGDDILLIQAPTGYHQTSGDGYLIHIFSGDGTDILNFDPSGTLNIVPAVEEGGGGQISLGGTGEQVILFGGAQPGVDRLSIAHSGASIFRITDAGAVVLKAHAAPADNALLAGELAMWFDQTNGAAKLMLKGKTADGTVVTGFVLT